MVPVSEDVRGSAVISLLTIGAKGMNVVSGAGWGRRPCPS
jgi:hypothetical protein